MKQQQTFHKSVEKLPTGPILFTYTAAVMHVLGLLGTTRNSKELPSKYDEEKDEIEEQEGRIFVGSELSRFYGSPTVLRHHSGNGNLELITGKGKSGLYRVSPQGIGHFRGRYYGSKGQQLDRKLLPQFIEAITTGKPSQAAAAKLGKMYPVAN